MRGDNSTHNRIGPAMSASQTKRLRALAEEVAAAHGCDVEGVTVQRAGRRRVVRVVVDHAGGLSLDLVADLSRGLSRRLDDSDLLGEGAYVLEVTSPGVNRPLTLPRHWERAVGRLVEVTVDDGQRLVGRVSRGGAASAWLDVDGHPREIALDRVRRATVQVEFTRIDETELEDAQEAGDRGEEA
jgi:ribosome maturation factor RimP